MSTQGTVPPVDRALTQIIAYMGHSLGSATVARPSPSIVGVDRDDWRLALARLSSRREQVRTECRTFLRICLALPRVHRRQLWRDFRDGWRVARGGAR